MPKIIMLEGKSDFYLLKYFTEVLLQDGPIRHFLPNTGSGTFLKPIQIYIGMGNVICLDA